MKYPQMLTEFEHSVVLSLLCVAVNKKSTELKLEFSKISKLF